MESTSEPFQESTEEGREMDHIEKQSRLPPAVPLQLIDTKKSKKRSAKKKKKNRSDRIGEKRKNPVEPDSVTPAKKAIMSFKIPKYSDSIPKLPQDHHITLGDIDVAFG